MTERENILIDALISAGHIAEQARTAMEKLKAENTELRHRAEVAERALKIADKLGELCGKKQDYIQQAERELAEEGKDD